jgi:S-formylglutathione hydrolase FrmB
MLDAVVTTTAIAEPLHVRIYLPADYKTNPTATYPTLYLLHGGNENLYDAKAWPVSGNAAAVVDASPFHGIVVMPEAGRAGWYTDWLQPTPNGYKPQWETFHIDQLVPWITANFRTINNKANRAIAGLSMGGFGALSYAGRHPTLFGMAGGFSGGVNITDPGMTQEISVMVANTLGARIHDITGTGETQASYLASDVQNVMGAYGSAWIAKNPLDLGATYKANGTKVAIYVGGTTSGVLDLEYQAMLRNDEFHARMKTAAISLTHRYCKGPGSHTWTYWPDDLADFLSYTFGTTPATCPNGWGAPQT